MKNFEKEWRENFMKMGHHPDCFYKANGICDCDMERKVEFISSILEQDRKRIKGLVEGIERETKSWHIELRDEIKEYCPFCGVKPKKLSQALSDLLKEIDK